MKAIELSSYNGPRALRLVDVSKPQPGPHEILIDVRAAGINFAELELAEGRYRVPKSPPFIMGFEAAGVVAALGSAVTTFKLGDRVTSIVSSGGYAEYAIADARVAIPIPGDLSFAEASTIPIQGLSAFALLKFAARPNPGESILIQAAAGGVGLYLVQLAKLFGVKTVIALASSPAKLDLVKTLGADFAINYHDTDWPARVLSATHGRGVDIVLEAASGAIGEASFTLAAPFGRVIIYGARNIHDALGPDKVRQLIYNNQSITGFNFPSLAPEQIASCIPDLLALLSQKKIKLFAPVSFPLSEVQSAFAAIANRSTIGKVVLVP
jgi:NADPH2:quinone reductase